MGQDERTDESKRAQGTRSFTVSGFPIPNWNEWEKDCQKNFGDCRWIKMWYDHQQSKRSDQNYLLESKIVELEVKVIKLEKEQSVKEEPKREVVETFTGKLEK